jgi:hypothetical protein
MWAPGHYGAEYSLGAMVAYLALLAAIWCLPEWLLSRETKVLHADRFMGLAHSVVASTFGLMVMFYTPRACKVHGDFYATFGLFNTCGFLLADLISIAYCELLRKMRPFDIGMFLHHLLVLTFSTVGLVGDTGLWFGAQFLVNELSVPPMAATIMMRYYGYQQKYKLTYCVVGGIFAVIFFFSRIVVISRTFYLCAVEHEYCQTSGVAGDATATADPIWVFIGRSFFSFFLALNCFWFYKILMGSLKAMGLIKGRDKKTAPEGTPKDEDDDTQDTRSTHDTDADEDECTGKDQAQQGVGQALRSPIGAARRRTSPRAS